MTRGQSRWQFNHIVHVGDDEWLAEIAVQIGVVSRDLDKTHFLLEGWRNAKIEAGYWLIREMLKEEL